MATTAQIEIASLDLLPGGSLNISANTTLTKAGVTADLDQKESGVIKLATGTEFRLGPLATEMSGDAHDIASYIYICNNTTEDATRYIDWGVNETMIGRLYAGDWMFIPWNQDDATHDLEITATTGTNTVTWMAFHEGETLETQAD